MLTKENVWKLYGFIEFIVLEETLVKDTIRGDVGLRLCEPLIRCEPRLWDDRELVERHVESCFDGRPSLLSLKWLSFNYYSNWDFAYL